MWDDFEPLIRDQDTARFAQSVSTGVHASQGGVDLVDILTGAGRGGTGEFPFEDAVDVALPGELIDGRFLRGDAACSDRSATNTARSRAIPSRSRCKAWEREPPRDVAVIGSSCE
jgi:hypothetical protein